MEEIRKVSTNINKNINTKIVLKLMGFIHHEHIKLQSSLPFPLIGKISCKSILEILPCLSGRLN